MHKYLTAKALILWEEELVLMLELLNFSWKNLEILPREVPYNPCFGGLTPIYPHFNTILRDF